MKKCIRTVCGKKEIEEVSVVDAHIHLWLEKFDDFISSEYGKKKYSFISSELSIFKSSGGNCLIDCTPYGCGRNGNILNKLSKETGINIVAVTGFHEQRFNFSNSYIWNFNQEQAEDFFTNEINYCLEECRGIDESIKAGIVKMAFDGELRGKCWDLSKAAIAAAKKTGAPILVHTDQGLNIEYLTDFLEQNEVNPQKVMINHIDKRNDIGLHLKLAKKGYYLEYDTFLRPKYLPETNLWPLILQMVQAGYENSIIAASDIYDDDMWKTMSKDGGLKTFFSTIVSRLNEMKLTKNAIEKIIGGNAVRYLTI